MPASSVVQIWLCRPADHPAAAAEQRLLPWLDKAETRRWRSHVFARDRHSYLLAHALLRWALTEARPTVLPQAWRFQADHLGHPIVAGPDNGTDLRFSLSHTGGMTAVAIAADGAIGIDVEDTREPDDGALAAAAAAFAPSERRWLERQSRAAEATLRIWTLKEAYAKARGLGLHLPFDAFAFDLATRRGVRGFVPPSDDPAGPVWRFLELGPRRCRLAVAHRGSGHESCDRLTIGMPSADWTRRRLRVALRDDAGWRRL